MSTSPGQHNLKYGWLSKARIEKAEEAQRKKTEAEKAQKSKDKPSGSPWVPRAQACFRLPRKYRSFVGLLSTPEVGWATKATWSQREEPKEPQDSDKIQYCEVDRSQLRQIEQYSDGEEVLVWVRGVRRMGWLAKSKKEQGGDLNMTTAD